MVLDSIYRINLSNARSFYSYQHKPVMGLIEHIYIYIECLPEHVACWVAMQDAHEPIEADEGKQ